MEINPLVKTVYWKEKELVLADFNKVYTPLRERKSGDTTRTINDIEYNKFLILDNQINKELFSLLSDLHDNVKNKFISERYVYSKEGRLILLLCIDEALFSFLAQQEDLSKIFRNRINNDFVIAKNEYEKNELEINFIKNERLVMNTQYLKEKANEKLELEGQIEKLMRQISYLSIYELTLLFSHIKQIEKKIQYLDEMSNQLKEKRREMLYMVARFSKMKNIQTLEKEKVARINAMEQEWLPKKERLISILSEVITPLMKDGQVFEKYLDDWAKKLLSDDELSNGLIDIKEKIEGE